jgi:Tol biopolymer transport system component
MKVRHHFFALIMALLLTACSSGLSNATPEPTVFVPIIGGGEATSPANGTDVPATELAPAGWVNLGLAGRLQYTLGKDGIRQLDLATGETRDVFVPVANTWLTSAATSPDGSQLAVAYAPPPPTGVAQLGYTGIYVLPGDCAERDGACTVDDLEGLVTQVNPHEAYFSPTWSADGQTLYFAHFTPSQGDSNTPFKYTLERKSLPDGQPEILVENAIWPALSADGSQIAYVWFDPEDYSNDLFIASADGSNQRVLVDPTLFEAVDAPFFSADSEYVIFSAVGDGTGAPPATPASAGWLDRLLGARTAYAAPEAHNVPSDWWRVPVAGGAPERLSQIFDTGLYGDAGPNDEWFTFISASGLYVMPPDGGDVTRLARVAGGGTVEWLSP